MSLFPSLRTCSDPVELMRAQVAFLITFIGIGFSIFSGGIKLYRQEYVTGGIDLLTAFLLALGLVLVRTVLNFRIWRESALIIMSAYFLYLFASPNNGNSAALWTLFIPLIASYISGLRRSLVIIVLTLCVVLIHFIWLSAPYYTPVFKIRFLAVFVLLTILAHAYNTMQGMMLRSLNREVCHRKELHSDLEREKEYLERLYQTLPCAIISRSSDGTITRFNAEAERLTGYSAPDILNQSSQPWIPSGKNSNADNANGCTPEKTSGSRLECRIRRKDGTSLEVLGSSVPVFDKNGTAHSTVDLFFDISERKRLENELILARTRAELESRKALEASRAKSVFLMSMSHELRTPINGIIGMNSLMLDTPLTREQHEFTDNIGRTSENLLAIINDVLDFVDVETGSMILAPVPVDLRSLIDKIMCAAADSTTKTNLDIQALVETSVPQYCLVDPVRLRQIIRNLVDNAIKFTPSGEVFLTVRTVERSDGNVSLRFDIIDTGIGIPPEKRQILFKPFSQIETSAARIHYGSGLGLALSRRLAELLGGEIGLSSKPGKGSTFYFTIELPVCSPPADAPTTLLNASTLQGMHLALITPCPLEQKVLVYYIENAGGAATTFSTPADFIEHLRNSPAISLPVFNAIIVAGKQDSATSSNWLLSVKLETRLRTIPLMILSRKHRDTNDEPGISAILTRPVQQYQLTTAILKTCRKQSETAQGPVVTIKNRQTEPPGTKDLSEIKPLRILVAEDNAVNRKVVECYLQKAGYDAEIAKNGAEAVALHQQNHHDLILMDCLMPEMSGYDATRAIRDEEKQTPSSPATIICALTANTSEEDKKRCFECGMDDFLTKPVSWKDFDATLKKWEVTIRHRRNRGSSATEINKKA